METQRLELVNLINVTENYEDIECLAELYATITRFKILCHEVEIVDVYWQDVDDIDTYIIEFKDCTGEVYAITWKTLNHVLELYSPACERVHEWATSKGINGYEYQLIFFSISDTMTFLRFRVGEEEVDIHF